MIEPGSRHICLVTPGHLATNPRLVKEADALHAAGYRVSVVAGRFIDWADQADREFDSRPWRVHRTAFGPLAGKRRYLAQGIRRRLSRLIHHRSGRLAEWAFHPAIPALTRLACSIQADLYIAHNLAALPAAWQAARRHGAKLGFDAEDFHIGELSDSPENASARLHIRQIEGRYLPYCDYISAASPGIAEAYAATYSLPLPKVVLNTFPLSTAAPVPEPQPEPKWSSVYWFSQTIGPDRGLETAVQAIGLAHTKPRLYLRGNVSPEFASHLLALAARHGASERLVIESPAMPQEMSRLAAAHDLGLAAEVSTTKNHAICLSNKIFTYLLAGLPVLASDTEAQTRLALEFPDVIELYEQGNARSLAAAMDTGLSSPSQLLARKRAAWRLGQERFNWEKEQRNFLAIVSGVMGVPSLQEGRPSVLKHLGQGDA